MATGIYQYLMKIIKQKHIEIIKIRSNSMLKWSQSHYPFDSNLFEDHNPQHRV